MNDSITLCVNIDHIATLRQARGENYPDPLQGALICEENGAAGITVHLREDRRHIQDRDVYELKKIVSGTFNLEMALSEEIIGIAKKVVPDQITLVPEKREELTTEGGLNVMSRMDLIRRVIKDFHELGIIVSLFIEPDRDVVEASAETGAEYIEIHTGTYCSSHEINGPDDARTAAELERIFRAADKASEVGLGVNAGHGLNRENLKPLLAAPHLHELNIGHSIISRSIFTGLPSAVKEILEIIRAG